VNKVARRTARVASALSTRLNGWKSAVSKENSVRLHVVKTAVHKRQARLTVTKKPYPVDSRKVVSAAVMFHYEIRTCLRELTHNEYILLVESP
jgi:hypothetical protein